MSRIMSASLTTLLVLASASPLVANGSAVALTPAIGRATVPVPNYPGCPPTTGLTSTANSLKRCNDTKTPRPSFTPLLDSLR